MLIPSIDLMGGRVVQLEQGARLVLASDDLDGWIARFARFPLVQVIDLDAALGRGDNAALVRRVCARLPCQVGGGVRDVARARDVLAAGARRVLVGSALFADGRIDAAAAETFAAAVGCDALVAAVDARGDEVVTRGWTAGTGVRPQDAIRALEPFVGGFLYTDVEREGRLGGVDVSRVAPVRGATTRRVIFAGGVRSVADVRALAAIDVDAVVGMALYTGLIDEAQLDTLARDGQPSSAQSPS